MAKSTITVSSADQADGIVLSAPLNGAVYNPGTTLTMKAAKATGAAVPPGSVVDFLVNGLVVGTVKAPPYWFTVKLSAGAKVMEARAAMVAPAPVPVPVPVPAPTPQPVPPGGRAPVQLSDLRHLGVVLMPSDDPAGAKTRFGYSLGAITNRHVNGQLRLIVAGAEQRGGGDYNKFQWPNTGGWTTGVGCAPYEISLPATLGASVATAPRATLVRNLGTAAYNTARVTGNKAETSVRGFWYDDVRQGLWAAYGDTYNVAGWHDPSIMFLADDGQVYGPWRTAEHSQRTRGFLVPLPSELGRRFAVGAPPTSGNAAGPVGLVLYGLDDFDPRARPADAVQTSLGFVPGTTIPCLRLAHYDGFHAQDRTAAGPYKFCNWNVLYDCAQGAMLMEGDSTFHNNGLRMDLWSAAAYVQTDAVEGLVALGQVIAGGHCWYGPSSDGISTCCHGQAGASGGTGPAASVVRASLSTYSKGELKAAADGVKQPWQLTPTTDLANPGTLAPGLFSGFNSSGYYFGGATFDPLSKRLFVTENYAETLGNEPRSVVHVFGVR